MSTAQVVPRCYRHPDREGGRSCTRCGKPACSECLVQAAVGSQCLDCAKGSRPDAATRARFWSAGEHALVTKILIAVNVAIFVLMVIDQPGSITGGGGTSSLQLRLVLYEPYIRQNGEWYRLVSSGFVHFGIIHLGFNMLILWQLGNLLERPLGRARFALLYVAALLAGSFGVLLLSPNALTGGASGAVFGLMGAAAIGMHRRGINIFSTSLGSLLAINLILTFMIRGISIGGHLGGLVGGTICGWFMLAPGWKRVPEWVTWVAPIAVAAVSVLGCVVLVNG